VSIAEEPTALELVLDSVSNIVASYQEELSAGRTLYTPTEWRALHHDLWASYATYLYDQQNQDDDDDQPE
jgi:hypothetical protein